jgi:hypothetical protein
MRVDVRAVGTDVLDKSRRQGRSRDRRKVEMSRVIRRICPAGATIKRAIASAVNPASPKGSDLIVSPLLGCSIANSPTARAATKVLWQARARDRTPLGSCARKYHEPGRRSALRLSDNSQEVLRRRIEAWHRERERTGIVPILW